MDRADEDREMLRRWRLGFVAVAMVCAPVWAVMTFVLPTVAQIFGAVFLIALFLGWRRIKALERGLTEPGPGSSGVNEATPGQSRRGEAD